MWIGFDWLWIIFSCEMLPMWTVQSGEPLDQLSDYKLSSEKCRAPYRCCLPPYSCTETAARGLCSISTETLVVVSNHA